MGRQPLQPGARRATVSISFPADLAKRLDAFCTAEDRPRSRVVRTAVDRYLTKRKKT